MTPSEPLKKSNESREDWLERMGFRKLTEEEMEIPYPKGEERLIFDRASGQVREHGPTDRSEEIIPSGK